MRLSHASDFLRSPQKVRKEQVRGEDMMEHARPLQGISHTKIVPHPSGLRTAALLMATAGTAAFLIPSTARAQAAASGGQAAPSTDARSSASEAEVGEIIVTANRRAERLQDVPTSITAVTSEKLQNSSFQNAGDLQYVAPSLTFNPSATGNSFQIRGVGLQSVDVGLEKPVATFVDEVIQGVPRDPGLNTFADVQRVEVLRGPQGTLFGKNASAGVVSIITNRPDLSKTEAIGHFRYGTGNEVYSEATLNAPLADTLAARVTGVFQSRDGWLNNALTGRKSDGYRDYGIRAKLLWEPDANFSLYVIGDYQKHHDGGESVTYTVRNPGTFAPAANTQNVGAILSGYGITFGPENESYAINAPAFTSAEGKGLTGTMSYKLGDYTLTSITAYRRVDGLISIDSDQTPVAFNDLQEVYTQGRQFTEEVRLTSPVGGFLDYVAGLYYYHLRTTSQERIGGALGRNPPTGTLYNSTGGVNNYDVRSTSYAAFGQANLHFSDTLTGVIGLRYTHDDVSSRFFLTPDKQYTLVSLGATPANNSDNTYADNLSGRASLQYKPTRDLMLYATVARGYKGPAVGTTGGIVSPIKPETVWNYEIGFKSQLFDRRLTLNVSAFSQKFTNFQATTIGFLPTGVQVVKLANADGLRSRGIEADASLRISQSFSLSGSIAYNRSIYTKFIGGCYAGQPLLPAPGLGCYIQPGTTLRVYDLSGQRTPFAPWLTGNVGFNFNPDISPSLKLFTDANYSFRSKFISTAGNPNTMVKGYGLLNANVGVGPEDGRWRFGIYARNLLDQHFVNRLLTLGNANASLLAQQTAANARRTVGAKLDLAF